VAKKVTVPRISRKGSLFHQLERDILRRRRPRTARDEESFTYLKSIVDVLTEFNESPAIIVCWHKCDKDIEAKPETARDREAGGQARLGARH